MVARQEITQEISTHGNDSRWNQGGHSRDLPDHHQIAIQAYILPLDYGDYQSNTMDVTQNGQATLEAFSLGRKIS